MEVPRLHPDTIEEVQQKVDIVDVVSEHIVLKKRGRDYLGLCPFHDEKTPSFSVSQEKQVYYCFGCGAKGNTFKFLMEIGKQSFAEVVLDLAQRYQVPIKTYKPEQKQEIQRQLSLRDELYQILAVTAAFYQYALQQPQGEVALTYLQKKRKLDESTISQFQLGYAPGGWETLYRYLVEQKRYPLHFVEQAGLIKQRKTGNGYYDVFRDRLMIPISDLQGRVIGFGSRTLKPDEQPKYLNSPETPLFDKSKTLFAIDRASSSISREDRAIVVEGYFDAIALHTAGITNVVASLGTAFTSHQLKQLLRFTPSKQVILNFDADNAGIKATERAIDEIEDLIYSGVVQLKILNLPDGKDADEFLNSRDDAVVTYYQSLDNAPLWLDWQINKLITGKNLAAADELQQVATGMVRLLKKLQDINQRNYYLAYCAEILSQGDHSLKQQNLATLNAQLKPLSKYTSNSSRLLKNTSSIKSRSWTSNNGEVTSLSESSSFKVAVNPEEELLIQAESLILRIYLHYPQYREDIIEKLEARDLLFNLPRHRFLWQKIIEIEDKSNLISSQDNNILLAQLHNASLAFPEDMQEVTKLFYLNDKEKEDVFRTQLRIDNAIASLELIAYKKYETYCEKQIYSLNPNTDLEIMKYYYQEIQKTKKLIQKLEPIRLSSKDYLLAE
ncbi:MAG: DNA primase [Pleurocapsa sp.]